MLGLKLVIAQDVFVRHEQGVSFASLPSLERGVRQRKSDAWLVRKLEAYYSGVIPTRWSFGQADIRRSSAPHEALRQVAMLSEFALSS